MSNNIVRLPLGYYGDFKTGKSLSNGSVFIGLADLDPEIEANRKTVVLRQEDGTEVQILPAGQPLSTTGGYILFEGSPVQVLTSGNYSIKVLNSSDSQVYFVENVLDGEPLTDAWILFLDTPTQTGSTTFTVTGDQTAAFQVGRRVRADDSSTLYGTITASVFTSLTTVTLSMDSGSLSGSLTAVSFGLLSVTNPEVGSKAVQYIPAGAGAVSTDTESKLRAYPKSGFDFGAIGDNSNDDGAELQALIDAADTERIANNVATMTMVDLVPGKTYLHGADLVIPPRLTVDANHSLLKYTGTGTAATLGTSDTVLSSNCGLINFRMQLVNKAARGVLLRGTDQANVQGYIQGLHEPFDNTRTNVGVEVDGRDISAFNNTISVICSHIHESFRIGTSGTVQPTAQLFLNCQAAGDQATDDGSIGYNFYDSPVAGQGSGTRIIGGNIEVVQIGIYFGQNTTGVSVDCRFEIIPQTGSRVLRYHSTASGIVVHGDGINLAQIGAVDSGIEGFDVSSASNTITDGNGNTRTGGSATSFSGFSAPIFATNVLTHLFKEDGDTRFLTNDDNTGEGRFRFQPGAGGPTNGAYLELHGHAHATNPGDCLIGPSSGAGTFVVTLGRNGAEKLEVDSNTGSTAGAGSAGSGNQYVELKIAGVRYKLLHDGSI